MQVNLSLTLEELYSGCTKKRKVTRQRLSADRQTLTDDATVLEIPVRPGWKAGTKITYEGEGDETKLKKADDIQFVVKEKPHERFERHGDDLHLRTPISCSLVQCATGFQASVPTLDERKIEVDVIPTKILSPDALTRRVTGEGMPISKRPTECGDLVYKLEIDISSLSEDDFQKVRNASA